MKSCKQKF